VHSAFQSRVGAVLASGLAEMFGSAAADGRRPEAGSARPRSVGDLDLARILQQREPSPSAAPRARPASRAHEAAPDMAAEVEELRARVSEQQAQMGKLEAYHLCGDNSTAAAASIVNRTVTGQDTNRQQTAAQMGGLTCATSAPGLHAPLSKLHRDWMGSHLSAATFAPGLWYFL
jgi:hypothetical protein